METNFEYQGWKLDVNYDSILVMKDGEHRIYDIEYVNESRQEDEYVYLYKEDGGWYQVKFEEGNFLVIDEFDEEGLFEKEIGAYVFGEENY